MRPISGYPVVRVGTTREARDRARAAKAALPKLRETERADLLEQISHWHDSCAETEDQLVAARAIIAKASVLLVEAGDALEAQGIVCNKLEQARAALTLDKEPKEIE